MAISDSQSKVPTWIAGVVVAVVVATAGYVALYGGHLATPLALAVGTFELALVLFVVYLLYRFVVAVETIAEKL